MYFCLDVIYPCPESTFFAAHFQDVLPGLLAFLSRHFDTASPTEQRQMLSLVADIILQKLPTPEDGSHLSALQVYSLDFGRVQRG